MKPGQSPAKSKFMKGSGEKDKSAKGYGPSYIPVCILEDPTRQYEFKYEIISGYLKVIHFEYGRGYGRKKWENVGECRYKDVSHEQELMEKIKKQGDRWRQLKTEDSDIALYEQRDKKGKRTGNYKLFAKEYGKSNRIERYYVIEELRHEI